MNITIWKNIHNYLGLASALFLTVLLVTGILLNHPKWIEKNSPTIVVADPVHLQKIFMGKKDGLYVSLDRGQTWEEVPMLFPPQEVADIAFSAAAPQSIYVLEKWGKIFHAEDGKIWNNIAVPFDPQSTGIELNKISIGKENKICVFTTNGWMTSTDGGRSWDTASLDLKGRPAHRLVLMLHNGYFFGPRFAWLYDFAAAALLMLIITGFILWKSGRRIG